MHKSFSNLSHNFYHLKSKRGRGKKSARTKEHLSAVGKTHLNTVIRAMNKFNATTEITRLVK